MMELLHFLAQTTNQAVPVVPVQPPPSWGDEVVKIFAAVFAAVGGTTGIIAIIMAWKHGGAIGRVEKRTVRQHDKINELAEKNPAEVAPLPPISNDKT